MLKAKILPKILEQANTSGVQGSILLNDEGSLVASSGKDDGNQNLIAAIVGNIWCSYEKAEVKSPLNVLLLENENGKFVITRVTQFILCIYGDEIEFGLLKAKVQTIATYLREKLKDIENSDQ